MKAKSIVTSLTAMLATVIGLSAQAAPDEKQIYHCEYSINQAGKLFTMSGNIVPGDATTEPNSETYLSLEPPEVSGIDVTARILITYWTDNGNYYYNPMTLHPRGNTAKILGSALLTGSEQQLIYEDQKNNSSYSVFCKLK